MGQKSTEKNAPLLAIGQIRANISGRTKPRQICAVFRRPSLRTYPNRNQQISSFTEIVNAELDLSWTKGQIRTVFNIGKRQVHRALHVVADDNRRE
jgi:hypothetical protein